MEQIDKIIKTALTEEDTSEAVFNDINDRLIIKLHDIKQSETHTGNSVNLIIICGLLLTLITMMFLFFILPVLILKLLACAVLGVSFIAMLSLLVLNKNYLRRILCF